MSVHGQGWDEEVKIITKVKNYKKIIAKTKFL
jgi:hypothetical protein